MYSFQSITRPAFDFFQKINRAFHLFIPFCFHKDARLFFLASLIVMGVDIYAAAALPFAFAEIVNSLKVRGVGETASFLLTGAGVFFSLTLLSKTMSFLQDLLFYPVINVAIRELHFRIPFHIHGLSMQEYEKLSLPEVISFTKRVGLSARFFLRTILVTLVPTCIKFTVAFVILMNIGVFRVGLITGAILLILSYALALRLYLHIRRDAWAQTDKVTLALGDSIQNTKLVRFYESFEKQKIRTLVEEEARLWFKAVMRMDGMQIWMGVILACMMGSVIYFGMMGVREGVLSLATLILIHGQLSALLVPLKGSLMEIRQIFEASIDIEKITDLLSLPKEKTLPHNLITPSIPLEDAPAVEFQQIDFTYGGGKVFEEFSLKIARGEHTLIFGDSGVGKSTLVSLATNLLKPDKGSIFLCGRDLKNVSLEDIGTFLHFIPQDIPVFKGSFYENLVYGLTRVPEMVEIQEVLEQTQLSSLIASMPKGILSEMGDKGAKLSGGEKQRLALARALLHRPKILIFDETTNALDAETENLVLDHVLRCIETVIFISHRPLHKNRVHRVVEMG